MIRLFIGLSLPDPLRFLLGAMGGGIRNARWVPADNLHITLRFVGEIEEPAAQALHDQLSQIRAPVIDVVLAGCGVFEGGRRSFTLWAGVEPTPALLHLRDQVDSAAVRAGLGSDGRRYRPHVTLARLKDPPLPRLQAFMAGNNLLRETYRADGFSLFSSHPGSAHPVYRREADYPLIGG